MTGEPLTLCAIVAVEGDVTAEPRKQEKKLSPKAQAALKALKDVLFDKGEAAPSTFSEGGRPHIPIKFHASHWTSGASI